MGYEQLTFDDFDPDVRYRGCRLQTWYRIDEPVMDLEDRLIEEYGGNYDFIEFYGEEEDEPPIEQEWGDSDFYFRGGTVNLGDEVSIELAQNRLSDGNYKLACAIEAAEKMETRDVLSDVIKPIANEYKIETQDGPVDSISENPDVGWDDIVLPEDVQETVEYDVLRPFFYPELREAVGLDPVKGVMLEGQPGVGKTLLAKVVASEYDANFYNVSSADLLTKWYGESSTNVKKIFNQAREDDGSSVIFIDEADDLFRNRNDDTHEATQRVVNTFLGEMDGFEDMDDVLVMGATNRYDALDPAAVRPGRFTECITIPEPGHEERRDILKVHTREGRFAMNIDYDELAERTAGYVGADLKGLADYARKSALRRIDTDGRSGGEHELLAKTVQVTPDDFERAFEKMAEESVEGPEADMFA